MQTYYMNYLSAVKPFILQSEADRRDPYFDTATPQRATIGYGFNLEVKNPITGVPEYLLLVLNQIIGFSGRTDSEVLEITNRFLAAIENTPDGNDAQLKTNLDTLIQEYGATNFAFFDTSEADAVFSGILQGATVGGIVVEGKEARLDRIIGSRIAHDTKEYVALMSLFYNSESLVPPISNIATARDSGR